MQKLSDIVFLTGVFPKEEEKEILSNSIGAVQNAANVLQWNLINGLDANLSQPISLLNAQFLGSYPKRYKKLFVKSYSFAHTSGAVDYNVGFCNLSGYKRFSRRRNINKQVKKWVLSSGGKKTFISYAMTDSSLSAIEKVKRVNPEITTCLVVPDLPEYMSMSSKKRFVYKFLKKIDGSSLYKKLQYVDHFVVLTRQMADRLGASSYTVVEGTASDVFNDIDQRVPEYKTIVYAGGLAFKYGVGRLLDAFSRIDSPEYRLILCGNGDAESAVKTAAMTDSRIVYKGTIPRSEVLELYRSASVLVNPRSNDSEFTKYSFPSKILEYLSSGVPVVAYKLDGIPSEYDQYINYIPEDEEESFSKLLQDACEDIGQVYSQRAARARKFVLTEKSPKNQCKKILDLLGIE